MAPRYAPGMRRAVALGLLALATSCGEEAVGATQAAGVGARPAPESIARVVDPARPPTRAPFVRCKDGVPAAVGDRFAHRRSALMARSLPARHTAHDVASNPGARIVVAAKVQYGGQGKDLEDEPVSVWLDDCSGVTNLGTATSDDDGRMKLEITAPDRPGEYTMHFVVVGDGTSARASLWVLPRGTPVVVFDIDGTLTQSDAEVSKDVLDEHFDAMYDGDYAPKVYADGPALADIWVDKGVLPIYISGRPYWLAQYSRDWLAKESFPSGLVRTTDRYREVVPKIDGVGKFKAATLRRLLDLGLDVQAAYGNAETDIWAYAEVGLPIERTFIIGPHAGEQGTRSVSDAWTAALPWAREQPVPNAALALR